MLTSRLQTTWGSRDGADADDRFRMIRLPRYGSTDTDGRKSETFEFPNGAMQQLPAYDNKHEMHMRPELHLILPYHD